MKVLISSFWEGESIPMIQVGPMQSQRPLPAGEGGRRVRNLETLHCFIWRQRKDLWAKEEGSSRSWKKQRADSPPEPPEGTQSCRNPDFTASPATGFLTSRNVKRINFGCVKPLRSWWVATAANSKPTQWVIMLRLVQKGNTVYVFPPVLPCLCPLVSIGKYLKIVHVH